MSVAAFDPAHADDACPGVLRLHPADDGSLARVRLPGGLLGAAQLDGLRDAVALGSGLVEITGRANVQLRGLPATAGKAVGDRLAAAGLLPSVAHDRVRNILGNPLTAGTDDPVRALDAALCSDGLLAELPGRFLFGVDDGSGLVLAQSPDVTLAAEPRGWRLVVAGLRTDVVSEDVRPALTAAHAFLALRAGDRQAWRIADLNGGAAAVVAAIGATASGEARPARARARVEPGITAVAGGAWAVTALPPLGRLDLTMIDGLIDLGVDLRLSSWRTLTVLTGGSREDAVATAASLAALGLVVAPGTGWSGLSACAGLGHCARARVDVRAAAAARAAVRGADDAPEHWVACERRCGQPRDARSVVLAA